MGIEDELSRELRVVAHDVELDRVPAAGLARLGEQEKRRRRTLAVTGSVAALCGVLVAGFALSWVVGSDSAVPDPVVTPSETPTEGLDELPAGPGTDVPWISDGVLHLGREQISTDLDVVKHAGGTTLVGTEPSALQPARTRWALVSAGELVELVSTRSRLDIAISADGDTVVWAEDGPTPRGQGFAEVRSTVTLYDVGSRQSLGSITSPDYRCCGGDAQFLLNGVDNQGRAFFTVAGDEKYVWAPGDQEVTTITGTPETSFSWVDAWPGGFAYVDRGSTIGTVDADGRFRAVADLHGPGTAVWSPDGTRYALARQVVHVETDRRVRLDLPGGARHQVLTWESSDAVILSLRGRGGQAEASLQGLVRCHADTGECESVADGPTEGAALPDAD